MKLLQILTVLLLLGQFAPASAQSAVDSTPCPPKEGSWTIQCVKTDLPPRTDPGSDLPTPRASLNTRISMELGDTACKSVLPKNAQPVLYLDHMPMKGLAPIALSSVPAKCVIGFLLERTPQAGTAWMVLDKVALKKGMSELDVEVGLGPDDKSETVTAQGGKLALEVRAPHAMIWFLGGVLVLLLLVWKLCGKECALIRDRGTFAEGATGPASFSLARTQLFLWLLFAIVAALYLWCLTGTLPALSGTVLLILLISGGTTVSAMLVDQARQSKVQSSKGFFRDVTNEDLDAATDTPSLHRLQQLIVTVLLLAAGAVTVYRDLTFPVFDDNWLLLMGLSAGTYLLGKKAEKS